MIRTRAKAQRGVVFGFDVGPDDELLEHKNDGSG